MRYTRPTHPAHWHVASAARVNGKVLLPGRVLRFRGERGTFAFVRHVTNTRTGSEWLDVRDTVTGALRAFPITGERGVRVVTRKTVPVTPVEGRSGARAAVAA
jgi:hypothetical protein